MTAAPRGEARPVVSLTDDALDALLAQLNDPGQRAYTPDWIPALVHEVRLHRAALASPVAPKVTTLCPWCPTFYEGDNDHASMQLHYRAAHADELAKIASSAPPPSPVVAQEVVAGEAGAVAWGVKDASGKIRWGSTHQGALTLLAGERPIPLYEHPALPLRPPRGEALGESPEALMLDWLGEIVSEGRGEACVGLTEDGGFGLWLPDDGYANDPDSAKVPQGETVEEAIRFRLEKIDATRANALRPAPGAKKEDSK